VSGARPQALHDTIVAIATPTGVGALGVIRLSGPDAVTVADAVTRLTAADSLAKVPARSLRRATLVDPESGVVVDDALVVRMPALHSYTGEDVVEISCHGNPLILARVVALLGARGARLASPGEFTRRAYVNGRMDLLQAEAVAELIAARSERAVELAARELRGGLGRDLAEQRERVLDVIAGLEVALDFPEEEAGPERAEIIDTLDEAMVRLGRLVDATRRGRVLRDGLSIMLVGAPNVGKSSLLNALLGRERAIVAAEAGTTRDLVDGTVALAGVAVRLVDGAGLGAARDAIDAEAMRRAHAAMDESDLLLVIVDGSRSRTPEDRAVLERTRERARLVIANKRDLGTVRGSEPQPDVECSALTGAGVEVVRRRVERWVRARVAPDGEEGAIVASLRVADGLERAHATVARAALGLQKREALETVLVDLREGLTEVESLLGLRADDAVLDRIFARFCVGK
jgi:tRNA modification GTPase